MKQAELFPKPARRSRGQLMHVSDASYGGCGGAEPCMPVMVTMRCAKCGHVSDWIRFDTVTEAKRGLPCPRCVPVMLTAAEAAARIG
jgi:phage FluMu protein Com